MGKNGVMRIHKPPIVFPGIITTLATEDVIMATSFIKTQSWRRSRVKEEKRGEKSHKGSSVAVRTHFFAGNNHLQ